MRKILTAAVMASVVGLGVPAYAGNYKLVPNSEFYPEYHKTTFTAPLVGSSDHARGVTNINLATPILHYPSNLSLQTKEDQTYETSSWYWDGEGNQPDAPSWYFTADASMSGAGQIDVDGNGDIGDDDHSWAVSRGSSSYSFAGTNVDGFTPTGAGFETTPNTRTKTYSPVMGEFRAPNTPEDFYAASNFVTVTITAKVHAEVQAHTGLGADARAYASSGTNNASFSNGKVKPSLTIMPGVPGGPVPPRGPRG